jgi:hypothetical protein
MLTEVRSARVGGRPIVRHSRPVRLGPVRPRPVVPRTGLPWTRLRWTRLTWTRLASVVLARPRPTWPWPWPAWAAPGTARAGSVLAGSVLARSVLAGSAPARPVLLLVALAWAVRRPAGTVRPTVAGRSRSRAVLGAGPARVRASPRSRATRGSSTAARRNGRFVRDEVRVWHVRADTVCARLPGAAAGWPRSRSACARWRVLNPRERAAVAALIPGTAAGGPGREPSTGRHATFLAIAWWAEGRVGRTRRAAGVAAVAGIDGIGRHVQVRVVLVVCAVGVGVLRGPALCGPAGTSVSAVPTIHPVPPGH